MTVSVLSMITRTTAAEYLALGLDVAQALGLPVSSWREGDPTRSLYVYLANALSTLDGTVADFIKAGWLSTAEGDWLTILAKELFGVDRVEATYSTPTITLVNGGGGYYNPDAGDLAFKSTASGKTFRTTNSSDGPLSPGATRTYALIADEAGSDSSVAANEIDSFVTKLLGVTIASSTSATAADAESDTSLKSRCRDTLGALSPNGPPDAYRYVALTPTLTNRPEVTRVQVLEDATDGTVTVYIASSAGAVSSPVVTDVQAAIDTWARPLTIAPTVITASTAYIDVDVTAYGADMPADFAATIELAVTAYIAARDVGETVYHSAVVAAIHASLPGVLTHVTVLLGGVAADVTIAAGYAAVADDVVVVEG